MLRGRTGDGMPPGSDPPEEPVGPRGSTGRVLSPGDRSSEAAHLRRYLGRFGYLPPPEARCSCPDQLFCSHLRGGLLRYQRFFSLPSSGLLDQATQVQMAKPRCGNPDLWPGDDPDLMVRDFTLSGGAWSTTRLRFFLSSGTGDISGTAERDVVRRPLQPGRR